MKRTWSLILLALFMAVLNNVYAQTDANKKALFYLKTKADPKTEIGTEETETEVVIAAPVESPVEEEEEDDIVFVAVETMPEFPGGQQAMFRYISENLKYPVVAQENRIQGRVICQFIINKSGSISDIEIVRSAGDPSLDKEAIRLIKAMPRWKAGFQRGKPVRVRYTVPVNFKLQ